MGFLANLGSGLKTIGSGFVHGAAGIGKGIGRGFKRLGQLGAGEDDLGPGGTPGINPNAGYSGGMGVDILEDAVAGAENTARGKADFSFFPLSGRNMDYPDRDVTVRDETPVRSELPIDRRDLSLPALTPAPSLTELRSPLPTLPASRRPVPVPAAAPVAAGMDALKPEMDMDRRNVPIPRLPGKSGPPTPYNTIDAAKYDEVMSHAKRDAEGNLIPKSEGGGFNRDWGMTLKNALLGASTAVANTRPGEDPIGRAIGGAVTAGAGSAINPEAGYEFAFDVGQRPKLEAEVARARAEQDRQRIERAAAMDETLKRGEIDMLPIKADQERAQTEQMRANVEIARQNAQRQNTLTQSQIKLNEARAEAARTGKAVIQDVVDEDGQTRTYQVFSNGAMVELGHSAKAAMNKANIQSREKIATQGNQSAERRVGMQQGGANSRNAATIAGAKERTQMRIDAQPQGGQGQSKLRKPSGGQSGQSGSTADMGKLREFYKKRGITDDAEIRRRAAKLGYTVKD